MDQTPKKILIVEDDGLLAKLYAKEFESAGYQTFHAEDGEKALGIAINDHPDLIVLDIALPKMQGTEVMSRLRQDPIGAKTPIIIITNLNIDDRILQDVVKHKPAYCLTKSETSPGDLLSKIKTIFAASSKVN